MYWLLEMTRARPARDLQAPRGWLMNGSRRKRFEMPPWHRAERRAAGDHEDRGDQSPTGRSVMMVAVSTLERLRARRLRDRCRR